MNSENLLPMSDTMSTLDVVHRAPESQRRISGNYVVIPSHSTSLAEYWFLVVKHMWTILGATLVVVTLVSIVTFRLTPLYEASARIAIYKEVADGLGFNGPKSGADTWADWDSNIDLDTQVKVLQSDTIAMDVVNGLHLDTNPSFTKSVGNLDAVLREAELITKFRKNLKVTVIPRTRVVEIKFLSPDPRLAAQVVNALANAYIEQNFKTK